MVEVTNHHGVTDILHHQNALLHTDWFEKSQTTVSSVQINQHFVYQSLKFQNLTK